MHIRQTLFGAASAILLCFGLDASADASIRASFEGATAQVVVRSVKESTPSNADRVTVYADVVVESEARLSSADLGCLMLQAPGAPASKPYVNSIASVLTNKYPADADGIVRAKLYWVFRGQKIAEFKPDDLVLVVPHSRTPCLTRESASQG